MTREKKRGKFAVTVRQVNQKAISRVKHNLHCTNRKKLVVAFPDLAGDACVRVLSRNASKPASISGFFYVRKSTQLVA